uniref:Nonstructural protein n=1 Tax=Dulem virus 171 TaxID=3145648 RepID=A0AAU8AZM5_9VIRU
MKYPVFAIRDSKVGFLSPTIDENAFTATRNFEHAVMNPQSVMNSHPADYSLYEIGQFDTETGELIPSMAKHIASASDVL